MLSKPYKSAFVVALMEIADKPSISDGDLNKVLQKWLKTANEHIPTSNGKISNVAEFVNECLRGLQDPSMSWKIKSKDGAFPKDGLETLLKVRKVNPTTLRKEQLKKYLPTDTDFFNK